MNAWELVAELTRFYGWGPRDALDLPWSELAWWNAQAVRMMEAADAQTASSTRRGRA